jgi:molecular chaperone GrpE (heat shock protein)
MDENGWWRTAWRRIRPRGEPKCGQLTEQLRSQAEQLRSENEQLRSQLATLARERDEAVEAAAEARKQAERAEADLHRRPRPSPPSPAADLDHVSWTAKELVVITDRLTDVIHAGPVDPQRTMTIVQWVNETIGDLLARCGVVTINDAGPVDPRRHEVVEVLPAPSPELTDHIAETVQPGYELHGALIRTQRVIAYAEPTAN